MRYQVTLRYGGRYHTYAVDGPDVREALRSAAASVPTELASEVDLVELRVAVDPESREYVEGPPA